MKKIIISTLIASSLFANSNLEDEVKLLQKQVKELQQTLKKANLVSMKNQIKEVKALANRDNIKFDVDFRSSVDSIRYKRVSGKVDKNSALLTNRMYLGMQYAPKDNIIFKGQLSYFKTFGDSANYTQLINSPAHVDFNWALNESTLDDTIRLRQGYFLYLGDEFLGSDIPWTASVGRRPSSLGTPLHLRENDKAQSPLSHIVNVEFDGASFKFDLDRATGIDGMYMKLCMGRGLSNATPVFDIFKPAFSEDDKLTPNVDMAGLIWQMYDNGQYKLTSLITRANNLIGFDGNDMQQFNEAYQNYLNIGSGDSLIALNNAKPNFIDVGDYTMGSMTLMVNGIGDMINDFLDDTIVFGSVAFSKTDPAKNKRMLGSSKPETGYSYYVGTQFPLMSGKLGLEYNHGSKYFRSMTYGEDTAIGSKIATRGDAYEIYFTKPLIGKILDMQLRYTLLDYKYAGSNAFYGDDGTPYKISEAQNLGLDPVDEAQDLRVYFRYRY